MMFIITSFQSKKQKGQKKKKRCANNLKKKRVLYIIMTKNIKNCDKRLPKYREDDCIILRIVLIL
jgi:hypothetical protein